MQVGKIELFCVPRSWWARKICAVPSLEAAPVSTSALGRSKLASTAALCRFERSIDDKIIAAGNDFLLDMYFRYGLRVGATSPLTIHK